MAMPSATLPAQLPCHSKTAAAALRWPWCVAKQNCPIRSSRTLPKRQRAKPSCFLLHRKFDQRQIWDNRQMSDTPKFEVIDRRRMKAEEEKEHVAEPAPPAEKQ